jgi:uncharacterized small protein (DUF1192 family)
VQLEPHRPGQITLTASSMGETTFLSSAVYDLPMRKDELDRRSAELKARMLAQRNADSLKKPSPAKTLRTTMRMQQDAGLKLDSGDVDNVDVLKKRIAKLEKENESLRQQLALMSARSVGPERSSADSVREQRHNFFKYSNVRRY